MPLLQELNLNRNPVADVAPVAQASELEVLDLGFTAASDYSHIAELRALIRLNLEAVGIESAEPLTNLVRLIVST